MIMKRKAFILFTATIAVAAALLAGCSLLNPAVVGSGRLITSGYGLSEYNGIVASQAFKVHVVPDTAYSVQITCDDNVVQYLIVRKVGSSVELDLDQDYNYTGVTVSAEVHMPALNALDMSGASQAEVDPGFSSTLPLDVRISGASVVDLPGFVCGDVNVVISGASTLTFTGEAASETVKVSGASTADLGDCVGTDASVTMSGASKAYINVGTGQLGYSVSGASTLYYRGTPQLLQHDLSGASRLVHIV
jgi:hypothetical protein